VSVKSPRVGYSGEMIRKLSGIATLLLLVLTELSAAQNHAPVSNGRYEITSALGRKLYALPDDDGSIAAAQKSLAANPKDVNLVLALSKAQAAKRQYREAVTTCTAGLKFALDNADLYLERGHRELGLREFGKAETDLSRAAELDPKKLDSFYHLGLAHYFLGKFRPAADALQRALNLSQSSDSVIDCSNWLYVSLRRAGDTEAAANVLKKITPGMKNTEPHLLFYLRLLHFYQGRLSEAEVLPQKPAGPSDIEGELSFNTVNYGVGNWHLYNGDKAKAQEFFKRVVTGYAWNSWGFVGSDVELAKAH